MVSRVCVVVLVCIWCRVSFNLPSFLITLCSVQLIFYIYIWLFAFMFSLFRSLAGYEIKNTLVTDLSPDNKVKASMNEINASRRLKEAASHKAEAEKTKQVKAAEAEAEAR